MEASLINRFDSFLNMTDDIGIGMWIMHIFDNETPKLYVNEKMAQLLAVDGRNMSPEEVYQEWASRVKDTEKEAIQKYHYEMINNGMAEVSYKWMHPIYGEQYIRCGGISEKTDKGYVCTGYHRIVFESVKEDIKNQEKIKNTLQTLEVLNKDYITIYHVNLDEDRYICYVNAQNCQIKSDELIYNDGIYSETMKSCIENLVVEEDKERLRKETAIESLKKRIKEENKFSIRYKSAKNEEEQENFEIQIVACGNPDENTIVMGFRCIDEIVLKEQLMKKEVEAGKKRQEYRSLLVSYHALRSSMWCVDFDSNNNILDIEMTDDFKLLLGYDIDDDMTDFGKSWRQQIHPDDNKITLKQWNYLKDEKAGSEERQIKFECRFRRKNGEYRWYSVAGKYLLGDEGKKTLIGVLTDIDEEKKLKLALAEDVEQLKRTKKDLEKALERAKQASKAKSDFLSRMSHDIRTPINGIKGMLMLTKEYAGDKEKVIEEISKAQDAEETLELLVNDVLDMSRLEQGKVKLSNGVININKLFQENEELYADSLKERNIHVVNCMQNIKHSNIYGSAIHLKRIFLNIMTNCIKYNKEGGKIQKSVLEEPIDSNHSMYSFIIEDTGIGMSKEFVNYLFEPFTREVNDAGTVYQGTGLGMTITKELIELMGGTISVRSEKGVGSRFEIKIPFELCMNEINKESDKTANNNISLKGRRILLVEDNELNLEIAEFILKEKGAEVTTARNGIQAVDKFSSSAEGWFDLILMDIMMPFMDGYEATKKIRAMGRDDSDKVPIVAMTANVLSDDIKKAKRAGINEHIAKPIDVQRLLSVMAEYIN